MGGNRMYEYGTSSENNRLEKFMFPTMKKVSELPNMKNVRKLQNKKNVYNIALCTLC